MENIFLKLQILPMMMLIQMMNFFPSIYIQKKSIVLLKNMNDLQIFKVKRKLRQKVMEFNLNQVIKFEVTSLYGILSDDGEYLITWDDHSKLIQVRKWMKQK